MCLCVIANAGRLAGVAFPTKAYSRATPTRQTVLRILGNPAEAYLGVAKWDAGLGMLAG